MERPRRLHADALDYGPTCPLCGGPKTLPASRCLLCHLDAIRDAEFWRRRTCPDCGGPKWAGSERCRSCALALREGAVA